MSNLIKHAKRELEIAGWTKEDSMYDGMIAESVLEIIEKFSEQGHSGMSASICTGLVEKLMRFEPLTPLTGEASEWNEVGAGTLQNNRCSHVFKEGDRAYDSQGRIFRWPNGCCYMSSESFVDIEFPYTPKSEYVDVPEDGGAE